MENKRPLFFCIGLAVSLCLFFAVMELETGSDRGVSDGEILLPLPIEQEFYAGDFAPEPQKEQVKPVYEDFDVVTDKTSDEEDEPLPVESGELSDETPPYGQVNEDKAAADGLRTEAEIMPQFPGGKEALARFLGDNIEYPEAAIRQRKRGRVLCSFVVEGDGRVSYVRLEEGTDIFLDDEALRVLRIMPPWIPGEENGEKIRVKVYLPIVFNL